MANDPPFSISELVMKLLFIRPFIHFTKSQRLGLFTLISLIVVLQAILWYQPLWYAPDALPKEAQIWLQDTSSERLVQTYKSYPIQPFNPNFITEYKAFRWGMSVASYQRLQAFRAQGKFVNSAREFQEITKVPDTILEKMAPYFKFPAWVNTFKKGNSRPFMFTQETPKKVVKKDINSATAEDLILVRGIGPVLSERILKYRTALGAFVAMAQLQEVYGLKEEVFDTLLEHFAVVHPPVLEKIKINEMTIKELGSFPYFRYPVSRNIVAYRSMNGPIRFEDLTNVKGISVEKIKIIALYLEF